jgi:TolB-like protein/DNA-binding winged helix-turn-helix (wHTH) protein/Tfp pilus assembly protein PilF
MGDVPTSSARDNTALPLETAACRCFAGLVLDLDACTLARDSGEPIRLTRTEFALLRIFASRPGRVLSRETILDSVAGRNLELFDRSVDVLVSRLRRKIEPDSNKPRLIVTVPGEGYRFDGLPLRFEREGSRTAASAYPNGRQRPDEGSESPLASKAADQIADLRAGPLRSTERPVRAFGVALEGRVPTPHPAQEETPLSLAVPDKPSIAVLPFHNMSGDREQDYFADGMVEDIITGLSRIKWLFVIARNSSFVYKGKTVDVRQIGQELGVRYLLEGGVRKAGARLRITAQLIEAESGAHLWAEKFDGGLEDVFELQDRITDKVVGIVEPSLRKSEIDRSRRKRPGSLDAYDFYLRSLPYLTPMSPGNAEIAIGFLQDALRIAPNYAAAHGFLAWAHELRYHFAGYDEADKIAGLRHARAAIASDVDDATALAIGAMEVHFLGKDTDSAIEAIERALSFNHSSALAYYAGSELYARYGDPATATAYARRALRLSPFDSSAYLAHNGLAIAAFHEGRYEEAAVWWAKCAHAHPGIGGFAFGQAMALALAGRMDDAKPVFARGLEVEPDFRISKIAKYGDVSAIADKYREAGRLLGLPE